MKEKVHLSDKELLKNESNMRYYWCVNCGYYGDFGSERKKRLKCKNCQYDVLTKLDKEEYKTYK